MKRITYKKNHLWFGLVIAFFMIMFCASGIVLNHRKMVADVCISRKWLPDSYLFRKWNGGLLRGTLRYEGNDSADVVLLYGNSGIWKTDSEGKVFSDFNHGLPLGADYRNIRGCITSSDGSLWAVGQFGLYRYDTGKALWQEKVIPMNGDEKISDITVGGDTIVVTGRSYLYVSVPPYERFEKICLPAPQGYDGKVSLFRTVWALHSGEIFGISGRIVMDMIAVILIFLSVSGVIYWLLPKYIRKRKASGKPTGSSVRLLKFNLDWHDKLGRYTFLLTLFVVFTGWCLRPPMLIALATSRVLPLPFTAMDSENTWHDKLRMVRYDSGHGDWLLSSSEGMFSVSSLYSTPKKVKNAPPVSVMGLNVWLKEADGNWIAGSFSGMYRWNRDTGVSLDYFTGEIAKELSGPPFGLFAVSGYSGDIGDIPFVCDYNSGTDAVEMPDFLSELPMPLWNVAQEIHTGRIYGIFGEGALVFVFLAGGIALWCIITGYVVRKRHK